MSKFKGFLTHCPECGGKMGVHRSQSTADGQCIWRRRECVECGSRMSTIEYLTEYSPADPDRTFLEDLQTEQEADARGAAMTMDDISPTDPHRQPMEIIK